MALEDIILWSEEKFRFVIFSLKIFKCFFKTFFK